MSPYLGFRKLIYDEMVEMTLLQHFMILVWKKKLLATLFMKLLHINGQQGRAPFRIGNILNLKQI